jgi:hypothetical protein
MDELVRKRRARIVKRKIINALPYFLIGLVFSFIFNFFFDARLHEVERERCAYWHWAVCDQLK